MKIQIVRETKNSIALTTPGEGWWWILNLSRFGIERYERFDSSGEKMTFDSEGRVVCED